MNKDAAALRMQQLLGTFGCLPSVGDGLVIERFDPLVLAAALECETERAIEYGWPKITLHMDMPDAVALARFLRR